MALTDASLVHGGDLIGAATAAHTMALLVRAGSDASYWVADSTQHNLAVQFRAPGRVLRVLAGGSSDYAEIAVGDVGWHRVVARFDGAGAGNAQRLRLWLDGTEQTGVEITHGGTVPATLTPDVGCYLLNNVAQNDPMLGDLAAVLRWQSALAPTVIAGPLDAWLVASARRMSLPGL